MTFMFILVFGGLFGLIGGAIEVEEGFVFGLGLGVLSGLYTSLRIQFGRLERRLGDNESALEILVRAATPTAPAERSQSGAIAVDTVDDEIVSPVPPSEDTGPQPEDFPPPSSATPQSESTPSDAWMGTGDEDFRQPPGAEIADKIWNTAKTFFTEGNVVVKVGMVVLFFGVSFLIKFAHDRGMVPIEFRLSAIAVVGITLLIVGWKLRHRNPGYAMALQGGAIGILYLTVFGAARLYQVVPMELAFGLMIGLVVLSGALAVLQNAPALAAFGSAGGFLAPILTSTGQGSHVALFSYYALLNLGIFGIAWFKAWRGLNWLGFVFTFVIATVWGAKYYTAGYFGSTEPFLILFMLFYIGISVLFATKQPPRLRGLVDGSLVFGVPTVGFALQSRLVRGMDFALAYSSLVLGAFYVALAIALWRRFRDDMRLLCESFLALGVIFLSLAIPLALDGYWTAAAWSLEGAGIIWVGLRQERALARAFGLLLQIGAALSFVLHADVQTTTPMLFNSAYLGCIMIAVAGVVSAYLYARHRPVLFSYESSLEFLLLGWGLLWWFGAGANEIILHLDRTNEIAGLIGFAALSALFLSWLARCLDWTAAGIPSVGLLPAVGLVAGIDFAEHGNQGPLRHPNAIAWIIAIVSNYKILASFSATWAEKWRILWHAGSVWLTLFLGTWAAIAFVDNSTRLSDPWVVATAGFVPAAVILLLVRFGDQINWPVGEFDNSYRRNGLIPIAGYLVLWLLASITQAGNPAPLSYIPVLNPIEASGLVSLLSLLVWWLGVRKTSGEGIIHSRYIIIAFSMLCFIWFNAVLFRSIHHSTGTAYDFSVLWRSPTLQSTISLAWTVLGSAVMAVAALKLKLREVWIAGAIILGLVVVKLFTVDLADIGTVARIVSFMGVGLLLLIIGYFAPLPPQSEVAK